MPWAVPEGSFAGSQCWISSRAPRVARPARFRNLIRDDLLVLRRHLFIELLFDDLQVEAGALLHRRELECALREFSYFLLDIDKAPELEREPVVERQRSLIATRH